MARYLFLVAEPFHEVHLRYFHDVLGGEFVRPARPDGDLHAEVLERDGPDAVWFFAHIDLPLHPRLRGRQVLTKHGLCFARWADRPRARAVNRHLSAILQPGRTEERSYARFGIDPRKVKPFVSTPLFLIPERPVRRNSILFSSTAFRHWNHYGNLVRILERLDSSVEGLLAIHPLTPPRRASRLREAAAKGGVRVLAGQDDLLEAFATCAACVSGGQSSVGTPFWFLGKPVAFLRGPRFKIHKGFGWDRIRREAGEPLFARILEESPRFSSSEEFSPQRVLGAPPSPSAREVFFPANRDEAEARSLLRRYVAEVEAS